MSANALRCDTSHRPEWPELLEQAAAIVRSYDTLVTLRQLFYRLVAAQLLPNTTNAYKSLSKHTAAARRAGAFPSLMDRGRTIHRYETFKSAAEARRWLQSIYRRDRTEGQSWALYLGVEKAGIVEQLREWFGDLGVPVLALGGTDHRSTLTMFGPTSTTTVGRPCCSARATTIRVVRISIATSRTGLTAGRRCDVSH